MLRLVELTEEVLSAHAHAFWTRKLCDDAEIIYHKLLDKYGEDASDYYTLARVLEDKGDLAGAVEYAQAATSIRPQDEYLAKELSRMRSKLTPEEADDA